MRLALGLAMVTSCALTEPLVVMRKCTEPPENIGPATLIRCTEDGLAARACLYEVIEQGLRCVWQLERMFCDDEFDLVAHRCSVYDPRGPEDWSPWPAW